MKVIITGSLGHIGKPLAEDLIQKGHAVTVISSKIEKQKDIEALGASAAIGSLEDVEFLAATFAKADALFAMVPPNFSEVDQMAYYRRIAGNYATVLPHTTIKQVVHLSSYGAHLDRGTGFILGAHYAEGILNTLSDLAITHLRPGYFYYNLYAFTEMIKTAGFIGANYGGEDKMMLVAPADIAVAAAEELTTAASSRKIRYVVSEEQTPDEIARILGAAIGKPDLNWVTFTNEQALAGLEQRGVPAHVAEKLVELGASIHNGALVSDYEKQGPVKMGNVKLADFAKEFAAAF
ncbi:NAD(P)H-binding protein [Chitinophaga arvensicola]|uniref:Uncharacterized conserved protein YbjT, contains NAD(P)-binding and DUF2867 domains n=1 Tax=Chitinophaga arvensicola TaxID=29529 RepID=A0A1I0S975_9BACT|nr:NAD(P)H-binding protein [Chitinophaga arvensicola]SEW52729.1 Uncharacterized conserved protein YbjT, contains NAD(P)-binding and DUF2867 domains [Chitinophaga arvensicola]